MTGHLASRTVLKKVDQLRELNIGTHVSLPQLVVVGDQSSGKSSLLESLTGISFPTNAELCTRYVTQITCRRESEPRVEVHLIAGPTASTERKKKLATFCPPSLEPEEFRENFADILAQVNSHLGIRGDIHDATTSGSVFTDDVLKIEICSPEEDYLTIIDVPGIFRNTTTGVTTDRDIALVRHMVESHIRDPRTIILAVLPGNQDFATQEILHLAEKHDPKGERTIGVLTKPDLIMENSGKHALCNLILGKRKTLTLGYYLMCNRGPDGDDRSVEERELLFLKDPWNLLPRDRLGRDALKKTLSLLLAELTKRVFASLRQETQKKLENTTKELEGLGSPRETEQQQRGFLSNIAGKFQSLVTAARMGNYSQDDAFEEDPDLRLCTSIVNLADGLVCKFAEQGHKYEFEKDKKELPAAKAKIKVKKARRQDPIPVLVAAEHPAVDSGSISPISVTESTISTFDPFDLDVAGLLFSLPDYETPQPGIKDWIADLHQKYRGPELTSPGPAILKSAFKEQSTRWESIARYFVSSCIQVVHTFIQRALGLFCPTSALVTELWNLISNEVLSRYKASLDKALYLAHIERTLSPYTLNQLFIDEVVKLRSVRLCNRVEGIAFFEDREESTLTMDVNDLQDLSEHEANTEHANHEIHDALKAYYNISAKRFQDNLYMQAVSHGLVNGEETPLGVFSQEWVIRLGADELDGLVGDSPTARAQRREVEGRKEDLEKAVEILQK